MKKIALSLVLILGLLPAVALAQDATEAPTTETTASGLPALAGNYSVTQSLGDQSVGGNVTFEGTGPIYWASYKGEDGTVGGPTPTLMQNNVVIIPSGENCAPASFMRQSDGTLFGEWIDTSLSKASLGLEYLTPTKPTTDFVGTYDLVGSGANGSQYKATVEITQNAGGIYQITYNYTADDSQQTFQPSSLSYNGVTGGNVLGFAFNTVEDKPCSTLVLLQNMDGILTGEFTANDTTLGKAEGKPEP
jgi:hypothetical protein